jgi:hypothetical protein
MIKILCKKMFDYIPENINFDWKPLREQSSQEVSTIKTDNLNRVINAFMNGLVTGEKAVEIINNEKVFNVELKESEAVSLEDRIGTQKDNG